MKHLNLNIRWMNILFSFDDEEKSFIDNYKKEIKYDPEKIYVGFNTGCSNFSQTRR